MTVAEMRGKDNIITYSFGESFLDKLADYIEDNFVRENKDLTRLAIVFGGKRPSLFLKRELAKRMGKSFLSPPFFTIDEFVRTIVRKREDFKQAQDLDSCYMLYQLASGIAPQILKGRENFVEFLPWAKEILAFIDHMDLENVSNESLKNIESHARIGYPVPADVNRLLAGIVSLRQACHQRSMEQKIYSRGLQYSRAAELIVDTSLTEFDQIIFANFFYLNRCEERVVQSLYEQNKAVIIFQGDERQWPILRKIAQNFQQSIRGTEELKLPSPEVKFYSAFDIHAQVGIICDILRQIPEKDKTLIVLPQSDHLIPLISEIASFVEDFNVSMGYPLKRSSLYSLFEFVFRAQLSRKGGRYYTRDFLNVLRHPLVKNLKFNADPAVVRIFVHKIEEILSGREKTSLSGTLFLDLNELLDSDDLYAITQEMIKRLDLSLSKKQLRDLLKSLGNLLFKDWEAIKTFKQLTDILGLFLDIFVEKSFLKNYPLNLNIAERIYEILREFQNAVFKEEEFPQEEIFKIFDSKVSKELVSFKGAPLKGLQILGFFETRSLNFDHVIIMDVNEGVLPKLNIYEPLIPREVMVSLKLDRIELEEEIQRYQFMRLISSAKDVHLVYQEGREKERSRFVEELIWEEEKKKGDIKALGATQAAFQVKVEDYKKSVKKTPAMIAFLKNFSYSASSLNTYLRNPMDFYYRYVLGLEEQEDLLDEPEARHVGTFIHGLLEESFKPFLGKAPSINAVFRNRVKRIFDDRFEEIFGKTLGSDAFLLRSVLEERINRFLDNEEKNLGRKVKEILYLEHRFEDAIRLSAGDIKFKYIVDRVDRLEDGTIMIIDYKTGFIDQMPKTIERIESLELTRENIYESVKSFQIPLYFHYLHRQFPNEPINAALYNFRTLDLHKFVDERMTFSREQINQAFLRALDFTMREICDVNVDFCVQNNP